MNRSIAHSRTASGSSPSNSTESSPASSSSISSIGAHASASSRCRALGRLEPREPPSSSSVSAARERGERLAVAARRSSQPRDQALDRDVELVGRHAPEERAPDLRARGRASRGRRCRRPAAARRPRRARSCPGSPGRRPSAARRRAGSRRDAAAGRRSASPNRSSRLLDQPAEARLRLADGEVAVRLAGAGDRAAADRVDVEREADLLDLARRRRRPRSFGTPVTMKFCWRVTRTSPPKRSARSAIAIIWSPETSPRCTGTPM